jgi:hypothetical protein
VPVLSAIAPGSAVRGGPAFILTATGSDFVGSSVVRWDGRNLATTFVGSGTLTAQVPADHLRFAGAHEITVFSPSPGGGTSAPVGFTIPCVLAPPAAASSQVRARLGAYYFDGWAGDLSNFHFDGLPNGAFQGRQPLSGWQDGNACAVEQQLAWAHSFGVEFFVFDWYFHPLEFEDDNLNSALEITHRLADRHGMQYAILYVDAPPFTITSEADWASAVDEWVGYMTDPAYVQVNGKPLFVVIDYGGMRAAFGSSAAVNTAFSELRAAAQMRGLQGVYVVAGFGVPSVDSPFPDLSTVAADGYDAVSTYNYPGAPRQIPGARPFSELADAGKWIWTQAGAASPLPVIPVVTDGWDPRPWNPGVETWYVRSPEQVATFVDEIIAIAESTPRVRPEPSPIPPLVLMEAWNEVGEGSYLLPTVGDGTQYGDALAAMLTAPPSRSRTVLTVADTGPSDPNRQATGRLTNALGAPLAGATVALTARPVDGPGLLAHHVLSGAVPSGATTAVVGFRVNYEQTGPGQTDFSLYRISYVDPADGLDRVANGDLSSGSVGWGALGVAAFVPSDRGMGLMVDVHASASEQAGLSSAPFAVSAGAQFRVTFDARVAPAPAVGGQFILVFQSSNLEFLREVLPIEATAVDLGSPVTDAAGRYSLGLASTSRLVLEASYPGDSGDWPDATTGP